MKLSSVYFIFFCLLITFRDAFTQLLLSPQAAAALTPSAVLLVYCWASTLLAWFFYAQRNRRVNIFARWTELTGHQRSTFIKLGVATWLVYGSTVWGIKLVGAPVFNVIDYAGMPLITVLAGHIILREKVPFRRMTFGAIGILGVLMLFLASPKLASQSEHLPSQLMWYLGIGLALSSTITTSYCSALQKRQLSDEKLYPDEVLLYRFPIPAIIMTLWLILDYSSLPLGAVFALIAIGSLGVFLPLLLLCFGFMRSSLGQFSRFLFLIPVLTWIVVPVVIKGEIERLSDWRILVGAGLLLWAFVSSEVMHRSDSGNVGKPTDTHSESVRLG